jgi:outer membrane protein assembly factor BamD
VIPSRPLRPKSAVMSLLLALALALPGLAQDQAAAKPETKQERKEREKAEKQAAEESKKAEKQAAEDAKKAGKHEAKAATRDADEAPKDADTGGKKQKKGKKTKEQRQRELVESGAKTAIEWYAIALQRYKSGHYLDARSVLLPLEDSPRAVDIQEKVKLLIADTYFEQGGALNLTESLARYKTFLTFYPSSEHAAYAQYQLGRSYFKQLGRSNRDQSFTENAIIEYQRLIDTYPASEYVAMAQRDILEAKALRASHEFEVARFYWDWGDKKACATRLMTVLKERPELPERERALYLCAQSLYDIGRPDEAAAYAARLSADYPGTSYASKISHSEGAVQHQVKRDEKQHKELEHTHRAQLKLDRRKTKQIRRDSGLPGDVPLGEVAAPSEPPKNEGPSAEKAQHAAEQRAEREAADQKKAEEREQEEKAKAARQQEQDEKAKAKDEARAKEQAAQAAAETPKQKAEREKKEAKAKAEAEHLEADEQKAAAKKADQVKKKADQRAREEAKKAAEEKKKAEKKAAKQGS